MKNLNTILPLYDAITEQYRYRDDVESIGVEPCLAVMNTTFIPFIYKKDHNSGTINDITLTFYDMFGNVLDTRTGSATNCDYSSGTTYDYVCYVGRTFTPTLPVGSGYFKLTDASTTTPTEVISEKYAVVTSVSDRLKVEFSNDTVLSGIKAGFSQIIYLNTILKTPEYLREDTGDKRDGLLVPEKKVTMKSYMCRSLVLPEYIVDALMLVPLMDNVSVTTQTGEKMVFNEVRIKDPEWNNETYGTRAKIELQLIKDVVVKKLTFRETGYTGDDTMSTIKQGTGLTVLNGSVYELEVVFADAMPDDTYSPAAYVISEGALEDVQLPVIPKSSITANGFTIQTLVECSVRWTAIHV